MWFRQFLLLRGREPMRQFGVYKLLGVGLPELAGQQDFKPLLNQDRVTPALRSSARLASFS
jgi:hypothetical protein